MSEENEKVNSLQEASDQEVGSNEENLESSHSEDNDRGDSGQDSKPAEEVATQEKPKNKVTARDRIAQLTREKHDEKREVEKLRKEIEDLKASTKIKREPDADEYDTHEEYVQDRSKWTRQQEEERQAEIDRLADKKIAQREAEKARKSVNEKWENERAKGLKEFENFEESEQLVNALIQTYNNGNLANIILDTDQPRSIVDYFGNNVEHGEKIASMPLESAIREIVKLESKLVGTKKKKSDAPNPIDKMGSVGSSSVFNPNTASQAEYNRRKNGIG